MSRDVIGKALIDFENGNYTEDITTYSSLGEKDVLPLPYLFRDYDAMPLIEQKALDLCRGKVLDVGCGSGSHSLYLQKKGFEVTGVDTSEGAVATAKLRGVANVLHSNVFDYSGMKFDTILLLMNGIGISGQFNEVGRLMTKLETLLNPGGQILLDSSDIIYMFELDDDGGYWVPNNGKYYGELEFTMEYKGLKSAPFNWLYLDFKNLKELADQNNLRCELVCEGPHYDYLARLRVQS
ncbi:class I SAM-dependent methyltransferase [uncultured Eudoraea sp.]|uniref:class I SAM-dependent methyltransferase n=1 Tax=uncultured Eudoraea sp. TaxID=1035614 RepID=UPI0026135D1B|nr:class I SAM-dependent methyltransferase [uncultured Eudoraea sp.]